MRDRLWRFLKSRRQSSVVAIAALAALGLALLFVALASPPVTVTRVLLTVPLVVLVGAALRRLGCDHPTIVIVGSAILLYVIYLSDTGWGERNFDGHAQREYVRYLLEHHSLPPEAHCFVCHHPPLYYLLAAGAHVFANATALSRPETAVQILSLLLYLTFVTFGVLLVKRLVRRPSSVWLATALIAFWPYGIVNSVRYHNDSLISPLLIASLYFLVAWSEDERPRQLLAAALLAALALLTKSSGAIVALALLVVVAVRLIRSPARRRLAKSALAALAVIASAAALVAVLDKPAKASEATLCDGVLGAACRIDSKYFVGNEARNYTRFDATSYLGEPYVLAEFDGSGRQLFWNHLFKSSLFGTSNWRYDIELGYGANRMIALVLGALLLGMTAYLVLGLLFARRLALERHLALIVTVGASIALLMLFRMLVPAPHHADFRHVFYLIAPMACWYALASERLNQRWRPAAVAGWLLAVPFVLLSALYFAPKYDWLMRHTSPTLDRSLADFATIRPSGWRWDRPENLCFDRNHRVRFAVPDRPTHRSVDLSLDNNDRYELVVEGAGETRRLEVGPHPRVRKGLARYRLELDPPVQQITAIELHALDGDRVYCLGHLVLGRSKPSRLRRKWMVP